MVYRLMARRGRVRRDLQTSLGVHITVMAEHHSSGSGKVIVRGQTAEALEQASLEILRRQETTFSAIVEMEQGVEDELADTESTATVIITKVEDEFGVTCEMVERLVDTPEEDAADNKKRKSDTPKLYDLVLIGNTQESVDEAEDVCIRAFGLENGDEDTEDDDQGETSPFTFSPPSLESPGTRRRAEDDVSVSDTEEMKEPGAAASPLEEP